MTNLHTEYAKLGITVSARRRHSAINRSGHIAFQIHESQFMPDGSIVVNWVSEGGPKANTQVNFFNRLHEAYATDAKVGVIAVKCADSGAQHLQSCRALTDLRYTVVAIHGGKHSFTAMLEPEYVS